MSTQARAGEEGAAPAGAAPAGSSPPAERVSASREIAARVVEVLRGVSIRASSETELQGALLDVFTEAGLSVQREHRLSAGDRIDFLIAGHVGVEVKVQSGHAEVARQLHRYAAHPDIDVLVLVTTRTQHTAITAEEVGKPLHIAYVGRAFA